MSNVARQSARLARQISAASSYQRTFTTKSLLNKDFVQELYLRELKSYKPSPSLLGAQNQVRDFTMPPAPSAPALPTAQDLAQELESWDNASLINSAAKSEAGVEVQSTQTADEYLTFLERDHPAPVSHH